MPVGKHEAVAVGPRRVGRVVLQVAAPEHFGNVGHAHRGAGMARFGFFDGVDREKADGVGKLSGGKS